MQIGLEQLVIDWAKEEPKMDQIIWHIFLLIIQFLSRLCYLMMNFGKKSFYCF